MFNFTDNALNSLQKGAFLSAGKNKANVMTIGWGAVGVMWRKNIFIAPIRFSRHTMEYVEHTDEFCVSIPKLGEMSAELKLCGTKSGRNFDKISALNTIPCTKIDTLAIADCEIYYECKVLAKLPLSKDLLGDYADSFYADGDYHMLYIGEILN